MLNYFLCLYRTNFLFSLHLIKDRTRKFNQMWTNVDKYGILTFDFPKTCESHWNCMVICKNIEYIMYIKINGLNSQTDSEFCAISLWYQAIKTLLHCTPYLFLPKKKPFEKLINNKIKWINEKSTSIAASWAWLYARCKGNKPARCSAVAATAAFIGFLFYLYN